MTRTVFAAIAVCVIFSGRLSAHASEQGFVLLLPTDIYLTAGVLTVVASIILISTLSNRTTALLLSPKGEAIPRKAASNFTSLMSTAALFWFIWVGINGPTDPLGNLLPLTIWIIWWIGFVALLPIAGNLWIRLNPWIGLYNLAAGKTESFVKLPSKIGLWPAVFLLLVFNGFTIADIAPNDPNRLAIFVGCYWSFTFLGMLIFGSKAWLTQIEFISILFRLIGSIAPVQNRQFGFPGWATLSRQKPSLGLAAFCIVMLGSGSFDGVHETFWWFAKIGINPLEFPGKSAVIKSSWIGLILTNLILGIVFTFCIWLGLKLTKSAVVTLNKALPLFALSLIPITFGYHFAHYLTSFLVGIQYALVAYSDPFAIGADLFGVSGWRITTGFLNDPASVKVIWLTQATAVVISHVLAVILAHGAAVKLFEAKRDVLLSQLALSILMIAYTIFGLWLLASPRGV